MSQRRSNPPGGGPYGDANRGSRDGPRDGNSPPASTAAIPPPNALFAEMLRAARELLAVRSPLDAELMVSEILGTWWGQQPARYKRRHRGRHRADIEELVGEGLVAYAASQDSPAALALLAGIAYLGTARQAALAERAALKLMELGVPRPRWAERVGKVVSGDCYVNRDVYGDRDELVCLFSYAGEEEHALVASVEYNFGGMLRDGWVTSQVGRLLERGRETGHRAAAASGSGRPGRVRFEPLRAVQARRALEHALAKSESMADPPVSESFAAYHAFIRARVRALPPGRPVSGPIPPLLNTQPASPKPPPPTTKPTSPKPPHPTTKPASPRRLSWSRDRRAMLAAEFLASDEAEDLSDRRAASRCADRIIDYGCDQDFHRPLRVSPEKVERFLLDWLPRKVMLSYEEQEAMPHVLAAWTRWAGRRSGLPSEAIRATLDAVFDSMGPFTQTYRHPESFGLDTDLVNRLLPDGDLEALARRTFAFPLLLGRHGGVDLGNLNPADPADRRRLLEALHATASPSSIDRHGLDRHGQGRHGATEDPGSHIDLHMALADRLWRGEPPELWDAAQRLLDLGTERHEALHVLMETLDQAGHDEEDIATALSELPPDP